MDVNPIASNMTEVTTDKARILFSYKTPVACHIFRYHGKTAGGWYRTSKFWSATTSRHINKWLDGIEAQEKPQEFFDSLI